MSESQQSPGTSHSSSQYNHLGSARFSQSKNQRSSEASFLSSIFVSSGTATSAASTPPPAAAADTQPQQNAATGSTNPRSSCDAKKPPFGGAAHNNKPSPHQHQNTAAQPTAANMHCSAPSVEGGSDPAGTGAGDEGGGDEGGGSGSSSIPASTDDPPEPPSAPEDQPLIAASPAPMGDATTAAVNKPPELPSGDQSGESATPKSIRRAKEAVYQRHEHYLTNMSPESIRRSAPRIDVPTTTVEQPLTATSTANLVPASGVGGSPCSPHQIGGGFPTTAVPQPNIALPEFQQDFGAATSKREGEQEEEEVATDEPASSRVPPAATEWLLSHKQFAPMALKGSRRAAGGGLDWGQASLLISSLHRKSNADSFLRSKAASFHQQLNISRHNSSTSHALEMIPSSSWMDFGTPIFGDDPDFMNKLTTPTTQSPFGGIGSMFPMSFSSPMDSPRLPQHHHQRERRALNLATEYLLHFERTLSLATAKAFPVPTADKARQQLVSIWNVQYQELLQNSQQQSSLEGGLSIANPCQLPPPSTVANYDLNTTEALDIDEGQIKSVSYFAATPFGTSLNIGNATIARQRRKLYAALNRSYRDSSKHHGKQQPAAQQLSAQTTPPSATPLDPEIIGMVDPSSIDRPPSRLIDHHAHRKSPTRGGRDHNNNNKSASRSKSPNHQRRHQPKKGGHRTKHSRRGAASNSPTMEPSMSANTMGEPSFSSGGGMTHHTSTEAVTSLDGGKTTNSSSDRPSAKRPNKCFFTPPPMAICTMITMFGENARRVQAEAAQDEDIIISSSSATTDEELDDDLDGDGNDANDDLEDDDEEGRAKRTEMAARRARIERKQRRKLLRGTGPQKQANAAEEKRNKRGVVYQLGVSLLGAVGLRPDSDSNFIDSERDYMAALTGEGSIVIPPTSSAFKPVGELSPTSLVGPVGFSATNDDVPASFLAATNSVGPAYLSDSQLLQVASFRHETLVSSLNSFDAQFASNPQILAALAGAATHGVVPYDGDGFTLETVANTADGTNRQSDPSKLRDLRQRNFYYDTQLAKKLRRDLPVNRDAYYLDNPDEASDRRRKIVSMSASMVPYKCSIVPFIDEAVKKEDVNNQFFIHHPELEARGIKLTHIRKLKSTLLHQLCWDDPSSKIDVSTVAYACWYLERLVLQGFVTKANRKAVAAVCMVLAVKYWETGLANPNKKEGLNSKIAYTYKKLESCLGVPVKKVRRSELSVYAALDFALVAPDPSIVKQHIERLLQEVYVTLGEYFQTTFEELDSAMAKGVCTFSDEDEDDNRKERYDTDSDDEERRSGQSTASDAASSTSTKANHF